jgi:hypothetical protein
MTETVVYLRSAHSKTHIAVMRDGVPYTAESCNLDDLDPASREIVYTLAEVDSTELCRRCFPDVVVQGDAHTETSA